MTVLSDEPVDEVEPTQHLEMGTVARRSLWLTVSSLAGSVLAIVTSFVLARWLGPTRFGRVQGVLLIYFYAALVRSGALEAGVRRFIRLTALGRNDEARRARDLGTAIDMIVASVASAAIAVWGLTFAHGLMRWGLLLAPLVVVASTAAAHAGAMRSADHRFDRVAGSGIVRSVAFAALALGGVAAIGDVALFVAPALADLAALAVLVMARPPLAVRPVADRALVRDLVRSGLALGALPAVYWVYRLVGSTSVALGTDVVTFGIYSFAAAPVAVVLRAISQVESVLTPGVWTELARDDGRRAWLPAADRVTTTLFVVSGLAANLAQAGFGPLVRWLLPEYARSVPMFEVLSLNVVLLSVGVIPSLVLRDEKVGSQGRYLGVWVAALAVNVAANAVALAVGGGAVAVAWNDIWIQAVVVGVLFVMASRRLGVPGWLRSSFVGIPLVVLSVLVMAGLSAADSVPNDLTAVIVHGALRALAVVAVWAAVAWALRARLLATRTAVEERASCA